MKCRCKTEKMSCHHYTLHSWLFIGEKSCFSSPLCEQAIQMPDFYKTYAPSVGKPKPEQVNAIEGTISSVFSYQ